MWLQQSASAYLVLVNIYHQPEPLPQTLADQWLLTSRRSGSTTSGEVNMQGKIAGATLTAGDPVRFGILKAATPFK